MDIILKYAAAVVAMRNNLDDISQVTEKMIDDEIKYSLDYCFLYSDDDPNIVPTTVFNYLPHSLFSQYVDRKDKIKLSVHVSISRLKQIKFMKEIEDDEKLKKFLSGDAKEFHHIILNSSSHLCGNFPTSYDVDQYWKKLYFLAQITPYKPSFWYSDGETSAHNILFVDTEPRLLIKFLEMYKAYWDKYIMQQLKEANRYNIEKNKFKYLEPKYNDINYPVDIKAQKKDVYELYKFYIFKFFADIKNDAKVDANGMVVDDGFGTSEHKLDRQLCEDLFIALNAPPTIYELNAEKSTLYPYTVHKWLLNDVLDNNISNIINVIVNQFEQLCYLIEPDDHTKRNKLFSNKIQVIAYFLLSFFSNPTFPKLKIFLNLRITFFDRQSRNISETNKSKFIDFMKKIINQEMPNAEVTDEIRQWAQDMNRLVYGSVRRKFEKENPNKPYETWKSKFYEELSLYQQNLGYKLRNIRSYKDFLKLPVLISRMFQTSVPDIPSNVLLYILNNDQHCRNFSDVVCFFFSMNEKKTKNIEESV